MYEPNSVQRLPETYLTRDEMTGLGSERHTGMLHVMSCFISVRSAESNQYLSS